MAKKRWEVMGNGKDTSLPIPRYGKVESISQYPLRTMLKTFFSFFTNPGLSYPTQTAISYPHSPFLSSCVVFSKHKPGNGCGFH